MQGIQPAEPSNGERADYADHYQSISIEDECIPTLPYPPHQPWIEIMPFLDHRVRRFEEEKVCQVLNNGIAKCSAIGRRDVGHAHTKRLKGHRNISRHGIGKHTPQEVVDLRACW